MRSNFVQVKGFYLLGSQLKKFKVSFPLMSALCSIVMDRQIDLEKDQYVVIVDRHFFSSCVFTS